MTWEIKKSHGKRIHELKADDATLTIKHTAGTPTRSPSITLTLSDRQKQTHLELIANKDAYDVEHTRATSKINPDGYFLDEQEQTTYFDQIKRLLDENGHENPDAHAPELIHVIQEAIKHHAPNKWQHYKKTTEHKAAIFTDEHELILNYKPAPLMKNPAAYFRLASKRLPWLEARITEKDKPTIVIRDHITGTGKIKSYTRVIRGRELPASQEDIKRVKLALKQVLFEHPAKLSREVIDTLTKA